MTKSTRNTEGRRPDQDVSPDAAGSPQEQRDRDLPDFEQHPDTSAGPGTGGVAIEPTDTPRSPVEDEEMPGSAR